MAPSDDSMEVNLEFPNNTGPAVQGFQTLAAVSAQIREDMRAIGDAMDSTTQKSDRMREYWQQNLELVQSMKSVLDIMQTSIQTNQTSLNNNLTQINEILHSARAMGGNMGQAMSMLGLAGGGAFGGQYGNQQMYNSAYGQGLGSSQDFATHVQSRPYTIRPNGLFGPSRLEGEYPEEGQPTVAGPTTGVGRTPFRLRRKGGGGYSGGGGGGGGPITPGPAPGEEPEDSDDKTNLNIPQPSDVLAGLMDKAKYAGNPVQDTLRQQLEKKYPYLVQGEHPIVPVGSEGRAAELAFNYMQYETQKLFGSSDLGRSIDKRKQQLLYGMGINRRNIQRSQRQNLEPMTNSNGDIITDPVTGFPQYTRTSGIPEQGVEPDTLNMVNKFAQIFGTKLLDAVTQYTGYGHIASAIYGGSRDIAANVRQNITGFAQAQGGAFGQTDYIRSAGMTWDASLKSDFGLNPFYSTQDVMQAQMMGANLGLKGNNLTDYVNKSLTLKTNFGLTAQQAQQVVGAGLASGVGLDANEAAFERVRAMENSTQTSTAYGNQAYLQGMTTMAGMGAQGSVAAQLGVQAANFGANNFVLQAMGATGQEGVGTPLNNALMAQQLGTTYTNLYATERNMGAAAVGRAENATQEQILSWAQIDIKKHYKGKKEFFDKNSSQAMILQMILQSVPGHQKEAQSPQAAMNWAWGIVEQHQRMTGKHKPKVEGGFFGHALGDIVHPLENIAQETLSAPAQLAGQLTHAIVDTGVVLAAASMAYGGQDTSLSTMKKEMNRINKNIDNFSLDDLVGGSKSTPSHHAAAAIGPGKTEIIVGLNKDSQNKINTSIKQNTAGFTNGAVPLNRQPVA